MKKTFKYWIFADYSAHQENGVRYYLSDYKWDEPTRILIKEFEVEHALPDMRAEVAAGLEDKKALMKATAEAAINEIDGQIAKLLALEVDDGD